MTTMPPRGQQRRETKDELITRIGAARTLAVDTTLDPRRHDAAVDEVDAAERRLWILHGVRVPAAGGLPALTLIEVTPQRVEHLFNALNLFW